MTDDIAMQELVRALHGVNASFMEVFERRLKGVARVERNIDIGTVIPVNNGYSFTGTDFVLMNEDLEPFGLRLTGNGSVILIMCHKGDASRLLAFTLQNWTKSFPDAHAWLVTDYLSNFGAFADDLSVPELFNEITNRVSGKPTLIESINRGLINASPDLLEKMADERAKTRDEFYNDSSDFGIF